MTDIAFGATTRIYFNTEDPTGALVTLAGSPAVAVRNAAGAETTDGVTLAVDSGGTGQHKVTIDTSANPTFYATANAFVVVITAGTVGGVSAVGDFVGEFSVEIPVSANLKQILGAAITGTASQLVAAFTKWFNVAAPTGTVNSIPDAVAGAASGLALVGSNVGVATSVSGAVGSVTGNVGGNVAGSVGSVVGAVGSVTADVGITQTGADKVWASATRTLTSFGTVVADAAAAVWASATRVLTAGTNIVLAKGTGVTGFNDLSAAQVNAEADTALADYDAPTKAELDAAVALLATAATLALVKAKTDLIPAAPAAVGDIPTAAQNADKLLGRTRAGGADGGRTVAEALAPLRNKVAMTAIDESAGTATMTVYADDDTTPLYTYAVSLTTLAKSMTALDPTA